MPSPIGGGVASRKILERGSLSEFDSVFYVLELDSDINRIEFQNQKTIPKFAEFISESLNWIKDGD